MGRARSGPGPGRLHSVMGATTVTLLVAGGSVTAAVAKAAASAGAADPGASVRGHDLSAASWTVYHGDAAGTGVDTSGVTFSPPSPAWTSAALDGQTYGSPLEATGRVFVATENDTVYALRADTGAVLWSSHVGTAVPSGNLPCGDISPTVGITGTPVVDQARGEIFVVADELVNGSPAHVLYGLDMYSGTLRLAQPVDPPGQSPSAILQRTGLNLTNGSVVFGYGGNDGDCATYSGWIVSEPEGGGSPGFYATTPNFQKGAVWMGGAAPEVDAAGNIWAATGNGSSDNPYDYSDSVLELSSGLTRTQFFAPTTWPTDNASDADLGSTAPALLQNGSALQVGKSSTAYLLNRSLLGGISTPPNAPACGSDADGGDAASGTVVYVPCNTGLEAIETSSGTPVVLWQSSSASRPPIVAGGLVWSIGSSTLYGLDPASGNTVEQVAVGSQANHFPTPAVGDGLLLAPSADQVHAFSGSAGLPGPPSPPPPAPPGWSYWTVASDGGIFSFGNAGFYGSAGSLHLVKPIVGMTPTRSRGGYWLVASDGGIFGYGDATFDGSMGGKPLNKPIVGMAATPDGGGYWLVASDGGIFGYGDATFYGSMGGKPLNKPIVGMASTADGHGYWLVASDGGIFGYGDATFYGSMGGKPLNKSIVGMASTADGHGYWLVASDGGIFGYGDAVFYGSTGSLVLNKPVVGMAVTPDGGGYWTVAADGGIFTYGDAGFTGSEGGLALNRPMVGMAAAG